MYTPPQKYRIQRKSNDAWSQRCDVLCIGTLRQFISVKNVLSFDEYKKGRCKREAEWYMYMCVLGVYYDGVRTGRWEG